MAQDRRGGQEPRKTGGQLHPQLMTNTRSTESESQKNNGAEKNNPVMKDRVSRMRIENDLYERQNS